MVIGNFLIPAESLLTPSFGSRHDGVRGHGREGRLTLQGVTLDHPRGTRVRGTKQASAVAAALASLPGFRSAQEIHAELRRQGETVGLTTVYRHLQVLSEQGAIDTIRDPSGESLYRQCGLHRAPPPPDVPRVRPQRRSRGARRRAVGREGRCGGWLHRGQSHRRAVRAVPRPLRSHVMTAGPGRSTEPFGMS